MTDIITVALMLLGAMFSLLAAFGVFRLPDLYTRMQAATKSATLGVGCVLLAVAVHFGQVEVTSRALEVIAFLLLTAPIAAHMIARAAYAINVPQWERTVIDELHGKLDGRNSMRPTEHNHLVEGTSPADPD